MITAKAAWAHYTQVLAFKSAGVLALSAKEVESHALRAVPDGIPFPEHCSIDFTGLTESELKNKSKLLASVAIARGWQYRLTV